ncbi:MAG: GDSL-type esterase/lipase family protein [Hallella sp.]|uniref:acetylxylan esterase AxeA1 n=1 Tax=Hallella sp. TaxID=2980186 RepID=UPI002586ABAC|nr:acetylxylan esterase AxeA1 [Hallella sp.]MDD7144810.1 GDSL-type esterase/lipase family protein [Hallella sp.]
MKHLLSLLTMALCLSCTARTAPSKMVSATASAAATPTARHFVITFEEGARLTAYLPTQPSGRAIVDLPGGGYSHLAVDHEGHQWADWMNLQGIAFFVLEYRMPKGDRTIPLTDAYRAMTTVRDSATAWRVNPYDVGIMGFSAGGHLASAVSTHAPWAARPNFSILFYPVVSMDERVTHKGSCANFLGAEGMKDQRLIQQWSNDACVRRHLTPPACVILSTDDRVVPPVTNGVAYYSAMRRAGNNCALYAYPSGGHGYGIRKNFAFHEQMLGDLKAWLATIAAPREQALRVACIGNSITDGMGIDMSEVYGYPAVLQRLLGKNYNVKNFGVSARTLMNKGDLPYMKEQAWVDAQAFLPNIVVIKLGTNDSKDYNWIHGADYGADLQKMVDTLRALPSKPQIYVCSPIPAARIWGISDSVIVNGEIPAIKRVVKKNKLAYIDLHTEFKPTEGLMQRDGIHPTDKGAAQLAKIIAAHIHTQK